MSNKIKILFVIDSLKAGGAQRVMSFIASNLDSEKFKTTLAVTGYEKDYALDEENTEVIYMNKEKNRNAAWPLFKKILNNKYHIVFSTLSHINSIMAISAVFLRSPFFIGRETFVLGSRQDNRRNSIAGIVLAYLQRTQLDMMICQSMDMYKDLYTNFGFKREKLVIINNPISEKFLLKKSNLKKTIPTFITVGRLSKEKGHERILRCLAKLRINFEYLIIGSGKEKARIDTLIKQLNLTQKVKYIPFTKEISKYLSASDLYLQGSYVEGFPNALLESCAVGTPAIVFNAPGGINEIILHDVNGFIAESETEFVDFLNIGLEKEWKAEDVRNSVLSRYSSEKIIKDYQVLFHKILKN